MQKESRKIKGRDIKIIISGINIAAEPPHSPELYKNIFNFIKEEHIIGNFSKNERLTLDLFTEESDFLIGKFTRFTEIDQNTSWYNSITRSEIVDEDGNPIPQVESDINPNMYDINFAFDTISHKLLIDTKKISIKQLNRALRNIFESEIFIDRFPNKINTTVIPSVDAVDKVLSIPHIKKISLLIKIPNPDLTTGEDFELEFNKKLESLNAGSLEMKVTSQNERFITPDDEFIKISKLAANNGCLTAQGVNDDGISVTRSTKEYDKKEKKYYNSTSNRFESFIAIAKELFRSF